MISMVMMGMVDSSSLLSASVEPSTIIYHGPSRKATGPVSLRPVPFPETRGMEEKRKATVPSVILSDKIRRFCGKRIDSAGAKAHNRSIIQIEEELL